MANDKKAHQIIEDCIAALRAISPDGNIPIAWKSHFLKTVRPTIKRAGRKSDIERDILITGEYLAAGARVNPTLPATGGTRDEEPVPRGTIAALSKKHGVDHSQVRAIIERTRRDHLHEAIAEAVGILGLDLD